MYGKTGDNFPPNRTVLCFHKQNGMGQSYVPFDRECCPFVEKNRKEFAAKVKQYNFFKQKPRISSRNVVLV